MCEIKSIILTFENCEQIKFPKNCIGEFHVGGISTEINRVASNSISKFQITDELVIEVYKDGNTDYCPFDIEEDKTKKFDRINKYNDITIIDIVYEDDLVESYYVNYEEEIEGALGTPNVDQKSYISEYGNLYIVVAKDKKIEDYFDLGIINDCEYMDYLREMLNIGKE